MRAFKQVRRGDRVACAAYFDEHPRLRSIEILKRARDEKKREGDRPRDEEKREGDRPRDEEKHEQEKKEDSKEKGSDWDF